MACNYSLIVSSVTIDNDLDQIIVHAFSPDASVDLLNVEYSLDGINWQASNIFSPIPIGGGIAYVRDTTSTANDSLRFIVFCLKSLAKDESFTYSYSLDNGGWTSFHDYIPQRLIQTYFNLWSINDNTQIWLQNKGQIGKFYGVIYPSYIDVVFNNDKAIKFDSIKWFSEVNTDKNNFLYDETFTDITVSNNHQTTGKVKLQKNKNLTRGNVRISEYEWSFNELKDNSIKNRGVRKSVIEDFEVISTAIDLTKNFNQKADLIAPFIICRLEIDNKNNHTITLHKIKPFTTESYR